MTYVDKVIIF